MKHSDLAQWTDYVRGVASAAERDAMARHLETGCRQCVDAVAMLRKLAASAANEVQVPEHLVSAAKAIFPAAPKESASTVWSDLPRLAAKLIYSSLNEAVPEGARSAADTLVQVVYEAGEYRIDFQLEPENECVAVAVVGQVVNQAAGGEPVAGVPAGLVARKKMLSTTQSNRFGEFCLMSRLQHGLRLCIQIEAVGRRIEIPLDNLIAGFEP